MLEMANVHLPVASVVVGTMVALGEVLGGLPTNWSWAVTAFKLSAAPFLSRIVITSEAVPAASRTNNADVGVNVSAIFLSLMVGRGRGEMILLGDTSRA
ncbi:hypothetical protein ASB57_18470 [Bordetella sp. N]|nr:hypothetical protein ASB57_18470 [Bordetella sp. N]